MALHVNHILLQVHQLAGEAGKTATQLHAEHRHPGAGGGDYQSRAVPR